MNKQDFKDISMIGRLAYTIMCFEKFLTTKYPERDFTELSKLLWRGTIIWWDDYYELMGDLLSESMLNSEDFDNDNFCQLKEEEFKLLKISLDGIYDITDIWFQILYDLTSIYAYTSIPDYGRESIDIMFQAIKFLKINNIELPDFHLIGFSKFTERNGWGNNFDGTFLSIILKN